MKTIPLMLRALFGAILVMSMTTPFAAPGPHEIPDDDCLPKYPPPPVVKINVRVPACAEPGTAIRYCICIENCSTAEAHHVLVKNALPDNAKFIKADPVPSKQGPELQWNLGTVGGGAKREIVLWLQPTNKEEVKNCARVQFEHGQCVTTRQSMLPHGVMPPGVRPPVVTTVPDDGVLELKVEGPAMQYANLPAEYRIWVTNTGKSKTTNTQIRALIPEKLKVTHVSKPGIDEKNLVEWRLGDLEPGAKRLVELTVRATDKGDHCIKVVADADGGLKTEKEICTKFGGVSAMSIEMHDREDPVFVNHKTSYPVVIRNQGSEPLTKVQLKVFVPDALKYERANAHAEPQALVKGGQWIEFPSLPPIPVGSEAKYEIFVVAVQAGVTVFHIEVVAEQLELGRPVIEQESTTIVDDREKVKAKELSRTK